MWWLFLWCRVFCVFVSHHVHTCQHVHHRPVEVWVVDVKSSIPINTASCFDWPRVWRRQEYDVDLVFVYSTHYNQHPSTTLSFKVSFQWTIHYTYILHSMLRQAFLGHPILRNLHWNVSVQKFEWHHHTWLMLSFHGLAMMQFLFTEHCYDGT